MMVNNIFEIKCYLNDGRRYLLSSILNGVEYLKYIALQIQCQNGEEIVWDVPTWQVSLNIFVGKKCKLSSVDISKGIVIPMNMWIFEATNCGSDLAYKLNLHYTMNTIVLSVTGTNTREIPEKMKGDFMISATSINLQNNELIVFKCEMVFTKDLDTINLDNNRLNSFPACLLYEQRSGIRFLSLARNNITEIDTLFEKKNPTSEINIINLSHNLINRIGTFKIFNNLNVLDLSHNMITEINDDAFQNLIDLKQLHLQNNRIHYIGSVAFRNNINLNKIDLHGNHLRSVRQEQFPQSIQNLILDVRRNKLRFPAFAECAEVKANTLRTKIKVFASANPYHCDCQLIKMEECAKLLDAQLSNVTSSTEFYQDLKQLKCSSPLESKGKFINEVSFIRSCILETNCPQSCSCHLRDKSVVDVNCTGRRLLELPDTVPSHSGSKTRLYLSHNPLQLLSYRNYLANLSELHVDNCLLTSVTPMAIAELHNVKVLTLHNNLLQKLPADTRNISLQSATNVTLHNNRWACSCDNLWLPDWITKHRDVLWTPGNIVCSYLNKPVEEFSPTDINCTSYTQSEVSLAIALAIISIASTIFIMCHYGEDLSLLLYTKLGLKFRLNLCYGDQFHPYDIYVSYGEDNYKWVIDTLVPRLEYGPNAYKLCLHYRDFPADMPMMENIPWAIKLSRCSILVLSKAFMKKEWCIMDLRAIFQRLLMVANRLIIVVTDDLTPDDVTTDLRAYMNTHEYLQIDDPKFWEKLEMMLPTNTTPSPEVTAPNYCTGDMSTKCDGTFMTAENTMEELYNAGDQEKLISNKSCINDDAQPRMGRQASTN